ncbi:MAG: SDR family oxidoreductase [Xanthobacteraceae bacterium]|jgi:nucleoside-diphosphate-sugar epimerase
MAKFAFVAGATGAAATRLIEELLRQKWRVIGVSRKAPGIKADGELTYLPADLLDGNGLKVAISPYRDITHLFFTARASHEETGVEPVAENVAMLRNALDAVEATSSLLEHVHLVEGTKWYGMHLGNFKTPARENDPRHLPPNFYYDQQDLITERQKGKRWTWSASRPYFLIDFAPDRPRNVVSVVGAYAAICRELGLPLNFPGTDTCWHSLSEATDARQLARAMVFLSTWGTAHNEAFNVTNGDLFRWKHLWPRIARLFDMPCGEVQTLSLAQWMADKGPVWEQIVRQHKLKCCRLDEVALWAFGDFAFRQSCDVISSITKIRTLGFHDTVDTEELYLAILRQYREARLLP